METKYHLWQLSVALLSIGISLGIGAFLVFLLKKDPFLAIYSIFSGSLFTSLGATVNLFAILLLAGLSAALAFRGGFYNIGEEGQLYMGGLASAAISFSLVSWGTISLPLVILGGALAGAVFCGLAGALKEWLKVNEVVSTLLLNFVAFLLVDYFTSGPLSEKGAGLNTTPPIPSQFQLPFLGGSMNASILLAIPLAVGAAYLIVKSKFGFELRMMGSNRNAAYYARVDVKRNTLIVSLLSGALAGLAGSMLVLGTTYAMFLGVSKFYGFLGIGVALLGRLNPLAAIPSAFLFAILNVGGATMQSVAGVPYSLAQVMSAMVIIVLLIRPVLEKLGNRTW